MLSFGICINQEVSVFFVFSSNAVRAPGWFAKVRQLMGCSFFWRNLYWLRQRMRLSCSFSCMQSIFFNRHQVNFSLSGFLFLLFFKLKSWIKFRIEMVFSFSQLARGSLFRLFR